MTFDTRPPGAADPAPSALRAAAGERLLIADGAMGPMLQGCPVTLDDFADLEGCNEILNVTRPDIVRSIHDAYLGAGVDCITTNTFGANLGNLGEYGIADRIGELSEAGDDPAGLDEILKVRYRGCRYAFGYPACPDLEDRAKVMRLLEPGRIGVTHHPEASCFST